jgi:hypothetical protein
MFRDERGALALESAKWRARELDRRALRAGWNDHGRAPVEKAKASSRPSRPRNIPTSCAVLIPNRAWEGLNMARGILLLLLGVPLPIILLLALIWH